MCRKTHASIVDSRPRCKNGAFFYEVTESDGQTTRVSLFFLFFKLFLFFLFSELTINRHVQNSNDSNNGSLSSVSFRFSTVPFPIRSSNCLHFSATGWIVIATFLFIADETRPGVTRGISVCDPPFFDIPPYTNFIS